MVIVAYVLVALLMLCCVVFAIMSPNLVRSAVALGSGSILLAILFFMLQSPYAGGFELSVGAGLVSILFIIAISLTGSLERHGHEPES